MQTLCDPHQLICAAESRPGLIARACAIAEELGYQGQVERLQEACSRLVTLFAEILPSAAETQPNPFDQRLSSVQNASLIAFGQMEAARQRALGLSRADSLLLLQCLKRSIAERLDAAHMEPEIQSRCSALAGACLEQLATGMRFSRADRESGERGAGARHAGSRKAALPLSCQSMLDSLRTPIAILRLNGCVERLNPAAKALFDSFDRNYSPPPPAPRSGEDLPLFNAEVRSFLAQHDSERLSECVFGEGPEQRFVVLRLSRLQDPVESWEGILAEFQEITSECQSQEQLRAAQAQAAHDFEERTHTARALQEREERFRKLLRAVTSYVYTVRLDAGERSITEHGPGCQTVTGYTPEDYAANPQLWIEMVHPEDRDRVREHLARFLENDPLPPLEHRILHRDGSTRWVRDTLVAHHDEFDRLIQYDGLIQDITEQKMAEEALRESEEKYRLLFSSETDAITLLDLQSRRFVEVNEAAVRLYGYTREEFLELSDADISAEPEATDATVDLVLEHGSVFVPLRWHKRKDGTAIPVELTGSRFPLNERPMSCAITRDISERIKSEDTLNRLATAVDQVAEAVVITNPEGTIQYVNSAFETITGYTRAEALGMTPNILNSGKHEKDFFSELWSTIRSGQTWKGRITNRRKSGALFEEETTISPVVDSRGAILNYVAVKRDVTREIQLDKQFRQTQKMEAIGTLAGGIAHDFNNILAAIMGFGELARTQLIDDDLPAQCVNEVLTAAKRAKDLVRQILTFTRQVEEQRTPVALNTLLEETLRLMRATLPSTTQINSRINVPSGVVFADATQIHQVIINLCTNACHAMQHAGGTLEVSLDAVELNLVNTLEDLNPGAYLCVTVADTGHGMSHTTLERIFDPFFTTKPVGEGTGLGLATALGIVKSHGGSITVESQLGMGSTFRVYLPRWVGSDHSEARTVSDTPRGQKERILFVDDEDQIVRPLREILTRLNYHVTSRTSSVEAWELFSARPDDFDLVLTDQTMPNMTGLELARKIQGLRPSVPIILATGYGDGATVERAKALGIVEIVLKPMLVNDLARSLRAAFDRPPTPTE